MRKVVPRLSCLVLLVLLVAAAKMLAVKAKLGILYHQDERIGRFSPMEQHALKSKHWWSKL